MVVRLFKSLFKDFFEDEVRIELPGRVSMLENAKIFFEKFNIIFESNGKDKKFIIDLTKSTFIYPNVLFFFVALRETLIFNKINFEIEIKEGSDVHEFLDYAGFCELFSIDPFPEEKERKLDQFHNVIKIERGENISNYSSKACDLVDFLKIRQSMSQQVETEVISSIEEILRNVIQHSNSTSSFLLGQAYPTSDRIRFVFYDNGIGIKSHFTRNPYDSMHKAFRGQVDRQVFDKIKDRPANLAIFEAAKYGVSATDYQDNSGAGLNFLIKDLSGISNGVVTILSEDGIIVWKEGKEEPFYNSSLPYKIKGTLVSLDLDCNPGTRLIYNNDI